MNKTQIVESLEVLSKAEIGYKLSKSNMEWYPSNGIFSALYRTIVGESRKDILDLMDSIITALDEFKIYKDIQGTNEIILAINSIDNACSNILETYKDDPEFILLFSDKKKRIYEFKNPKSVNNLDLYNNRMTPSPTLGRTINTILNRNKASTGVEYINRLISNQSRSETNDNMDSLL